MFRITCFMFYLFQLSTGPHLLQKFIGIGTNDPVQDTNVYCTNCNFFNY